MRFRFAATFCDWLPSWSSGGATVNNKDDKWWIESCCMLHAMDDLPDEILGLIFCAMPCPERVLRIAPVCKRWYAVATDTSAMGRPLCTDPGSHPVGKGNGARAGLCLRALCLEHVDCLACVHPSDGKLDPLLWESAPKQPLTTETLLALDEMTNGEWPRDQVLRTALSFARTSCVLLALDRGASFGNVDQCDCTWHCDHVVECWSCSNTDDTHAHAMRLGLLLDDGQRVDDFACNDAVRAGHIDCLRVLLERGYTCDEDCVGDAAEDGRLDMLQLLYEHRQAWHVDIAAKAAAGGHFECLRYLYETGCPWDESTCYGAAKAGSLLCLRFAFENGCPWSGRTLSAAAGGGHLHCLRYAFENGCPWNGWVCYLAAANGHLGCLRYAHEKGCPWGASVCAVAAKNGHVDCLIYAHKNGCPWDRHTIVGVSHSFKPCGCSSSRSCREERCNNLINADRVTCLAYALKRGCPTS